MLKSTGCFWVELELSGQNGQKCLAKGRFASIWIKGWQNLATGTPKLALRENYCFVGDRDLQR